MANKLTLTLPSAVQSDDILNAGMYGTGARFRIQSSISRDGSYADLTGTGSTPTIAILTGTETYTGYDPAGAATTWYRARLEDSGETRLSDWSLKQTIVL